MSEESTGWNPLHGLLEAAAVGLMAANVGWLARHYAELPDKIPTHFGWSGTPDQWGSKAILWLLPGIALFVYLLLTVVSRFPQAFNFPVPVTPENRERLVHLAQEMMRWMKVELIALFTWIEWRSVQVALGQAEGLGPAFLLVMLGLVFGTIAVYIGRMFWAR